MTLIFCVIVQLCYVQASAWSDFVIEFINLVHFSLSQELEAFVGEVNNMIQLGLKQVNPAYKVEAAHNYSHDFFSNFWSYNYF